MNGNGGCRHRPTIDRQPVPNCSVVCSMRVPMMTTYPWIHSCAQSLCAVLIAIKHLSALIVAATCRQLSGGRFAHAKLHRPINMVPTYIWILIVFTIFVSPYGRQYIKSSAPRHCDEWHRLFRAQTLFRCSISVTSVSSHRQFKGNGHSEKTTVAKLCKIWQNCWMF